MIVANAQKLNPQLVALFTADSALVSSGLAAIADSKTDDQFTAAVFDMCDAQRRMAAPMLVDNTKDLPFDMSGYRCLFYENSIGGKRKLEEGLRKHLKAIIEA